MKIKTISTIIITCLLASASSGDGTAKPVPSEAKGRDFALHIYLPREITINSDTPNLGQVGIVRGRESLVVKAGEISLGRISTPGQEITVDRRVILSRLACNGIPLSEVILTGAEKVLVKREHQVIEGSEFIETALSFVKKNRHDDSVCDFSSIRTPKDLAIAGLSKNIKLLPCFVKSGVKNQVKVRIAVFSDGKEIGGREVTFRLRYNCRRVVTLIDIPAGAVIRDKNVKMEEIVSNRPEPANWTAPYGLIAKRRLPANTVIRSSMVGLPEPPVLLKRNRNVVIRIDRFGLLVTATGKTIQEGRVGEYIKVRNVDSQRIILAKVNKDGTVEPVF